VDPRTSDGLMFDQIETRTKIRGKSGFEIKTRKSNKESRGNVNEPQPSTSGFQMKEG
jgi:hypothetical protein